ncbi:MAG: thioredoxin domain-containing protein [Bacteroidota bacterium]
MSNKIVIAEIIQPKKAFVGNSEAKVVLMEFGEYENDECAKANDVVKKLLKQYEGDIKFNFRHFPLIQFHQRSHKASEAAVAALQEGKFWEMHNILFENRRNLGIISLKEYAKSIGLVDKNFLTKMVDSYYAWTVRADLLEGLNKGIREAPVFFVNDERVAGLSTMKNLSKALDNSLLKNKRKSSHSQKA